MQEDTLKHARQLRQLGRVLSDEDRALLREYHRKYAENKLTLYARKELREDWEAKAKDKRTSLSAWIVEQLQGSQRDVSPQLEALTKENSALQGQVHSLNRALAEAAGENVELRDQIRKIEGLGFQAFNLHAQKVLRDGAINV